MIYLLRQHCHSCHDAKCLKEYIAKQYIYQLLSTKRATPQLQQSMFLSYFITIANGISPTFEAPSLVKAK
jgi:hypothetical protein